MMVGIHAALTRTRQFVTLGRDRFGRLLSPALLAALVTAAITAAPAAADPVGRVTVDGGMTARRCGPPLDGGQSYYCVGSSPFVKIVFPHQVPGAPSNERSFTVTNVEGNDGGDGITRISATISPDMNALMTNVYATESSNFQTYQGNDENGFAFCDPSSVTTYTDCKSQLSAGDQTGDTAGDNDVIRYDQVTASKAPVSGTAGLLSIDLQVNIGYGFGPCAGAYGPPGSGLARDGARAADACTPPSHTKITEAKINRNTAFFRFTARHATRFDCELFRNHKVMFHRSCQSPKPYANRLPRGHYLFMVTGMNHAGVDRKPATKTFTVR